MLRYVLTSELFPSVYLYLNDALISVTFRRAVFCFVFVFGCCCFCLEGVELLVFCCINIIIGLFFS